MLSVVDERPVTRSATFWCKNLLFSQCYFKVEFCLINDPSYCKNVFYQPHILISGRMSTYYISGVFTEVPARDFHLSQLWDLRFCSVASGAIIVAKVAN